MTRLEQGVELWGQFALAQLDIKRRLGHIPRDNLVIWGEYLHRWDNEDWRMVLEAVGELLERYPELFTVSQKRAFIRTVQTLLKYESNHDRCLDTKLTKSTTWEMSMVLRELWVKCQEPLKSRPVKSLSSWQSFFE